MKFFSLSISWLALALIVSSCGKHQEAVNDGTNSTGADTTRTTTVKHKLPAKKSEDPCDVGRTPQGMGDNFELLELGTNQDIVGFFQNGTKFAEDPLRQRDCLGMGWYYGNRVSPTLHMGQVWVGRLQDICYCYAIVGTKIYRSPKWVDKIAGEGFDNIKWHGLSGTIHVQKSVEEDGSPDYDTFTFDPATNIWSCTTNYGILDDAEQPHAIN